MRHPEDAARLREIKRLLDRIQRLPHLAGMPANGLAGGYQVGSPHPDEDLEPELDMPEPELGMPELEPDMPELEPQEWRDERVRPPPLPSFMPSLEIPADDDRTQRTRREPVHALVPAGSSTGGGISPWVFIGATAVNTVVAAVLAVAITLGVARRDQAPAEGERHAESQQAAAPSPQTLLPAPVELLPIGSPGVPLPLEALKPTRLPFKLRPPEALQDSYILLLSGLPAKAVLTGASRMGADSWLVSPGALQRLEIMVPEWSNSVTEVGVELRRTNGAVVAQSKLWLAVPPPPVPVRAKLDKSALEELVRDGDRLLDRGDVASARAVYERAAAMGSAQAALAMGSTYDPRRLWSLGVFGMVGDRQRARRWYVRAARLGHPEARARIAALKE